MALFYLTQIKDWVRGEGLDIESLKRSSDFSCWLLVVSMLGAIPMGSNVVVGIVQSYKDATSTRLVFAMFYQQSALKSN